MSTKKLTAKRVTTYDLYHPNKTDPDAKAEFDDCVRGLQKIKSILIPVQYAAMYDVPFDVADALTTVIDLTDRLLLAIDQEPVT